jgi:hypothetical protein
VAWFANEFQAVTPIAAAISDQISSCNMAENKQQHWVPSSYLQAWADPGTPPGHTPYVHIFNRCGANHRKRSPKNICRMPDLYTIFDGETRELRIEKAFSQWERDFVRVLNLLPNRKLEAIDVGDLYVFAGAMMVRPPHRIDSIKKQWRFIAQRMRTIQINPATWYPPSLSAEAGIDLAEVRELAENPMGTWFPDTAAACIETLWALFGCDVLVNRSAHPFLTSDSPAVIYHPPAEGAGHPLFPRALGSSGCEITLPLSPKFALLFRHKEPGIDKFVDVDWERVFEINYRTITRACANIISDRQDIFFVQTITDDIAERDFRAC